MAVTVFGYGFRKRRRILFLRKPDKRPFTRVFLAHAPRCHEETERGPLYRGQADLLPRDRYRSLFSFSINDRAPSPPPRRVFSSFSRLSLAHTIHDDISTRISERLPLRLSTSYTPSIGLFIFSPRHIFLRSTSTRMRIDGRAKGRRGWGTKGDSSRLFAYCLPAEHPPVLLRSSRSNPFESNRIENSLEKRMIKRTRNEPETNKNRTKIKNLYLYRSKYARKRKGKKKKKEQERRRRNGSRVTRETEWRGGMESRQDPR